MKKQIHYLYCQTISGDGYSEPKFKLFADSFSAIGCMLNEKKSLEGTDWKQMRKQTKPLEVFYEDDDSNYMRIQIIEVWADKFHVIDFIEPNEVNVRSFDTYLIAKKFLHKSLQATTWEDKDEWAEYWNNSNRSDSFGAHASDGYKYMQVIFNAEYSPIKTTAEPKIIINVRGGLVESVYGNDNNTRIIIIDHDNLDQQSDFELNVLSLDQRADNLHELFTDATDSREMEIRDELKRIHF
jgi:hypothetical protein